VWRLCASLVMQNPDVILKPFVLYRKKKGHNLYPFTMPSFFGKVEFNFLILSSTLKHFPKYKMGLIILSTINKFDYNFHL
jgi:hypothetical protein